MAKDFSLSRSSNELSPILQEQPSCLCLPPRPVVQFSQPTAAMIQHCQGRLLSRLLLTLTMHAANPITSMSWTVLLFSPSVAASDSTPPPLHAGEYLCLKWNTDIMHSPSSTVDALSHHTWEELDIQCRSSMRLYKLFNELHVRCVLLLSTCLQLQLLVLGVSYFIPVCLEFSLQIDPTIHFSLLSLYHPKLTT
jgi:hypothetical protein